MDKKTLKIIQNLGYTEDLIKNLRKEISGGSINKKAITLLEEIGTPEAAINQIKNIELKVSEKSSTNKELIESLLKKCRRSLDAFARKAVPARIIFRNKGWVIEAEALHPAIKKLHSTCHKYFDAWAAKGLAVVFQFDSTANWIIITKKKSDQPDL